MTKAEKVLHFMQLHGSINPLQALDYCGCYRLASRINELRVNGHRIETRHLRDKFGKADKFATYILNDR